MTSSASIRPSAVRLSTVATSTRKAHRADFGTALRDGFLRVGRVAEDGLRVAAPMMPTHALVSAALAGPAGPAGSVGSVRPAAAGAAGPSFGSRSVALTAAATGDPRFVPFDPGGSLAAPGGAYPDLIDATARMTELNASYNLQVLQLQQQIQAETRQFNLISNVLKTKHDAAKNTLANLR